MMKNDRYSFNDLSITPNESLKQLLEGTAPIRLFNPTDEELELHWVQYQRATALL